jgi:hypothetical protein
MVTQPPTEEPGAPIWCIWLNGSTRRRRSNLSRLSTVVVPNRDKNWAGVAPYHMG